MSITIKTDAISISQNLKYAVRDNLLSSFATDSSDIDGILLFSLDDKFSFKEQAVITSGTYLKNLANGAESLTYFKSSNAGGDITFDTSVKAFDFSGVTVGVNGVRSTDSWLANEFNDQNKRFIFTTYVFIPSQSDWHAKNGGLLEFAGTTTEDQSVNQTEKLAALSFIHHPTEPSEYQIWASFSRAEDASGATTAIKYTAASGDVNFPFGKWAQVSLVRDATGNYLYIVSAKGVVKLTTAATQTTGKNVTTPGNKITWGRGRAYTSAQTCKYKISRGFIINLNKNPISDIQAFLKSDWDRQVARGRIS
ncbi:hypothetical protein D9K80_14020 [Acinetobacter cumulans]|uniref:Uncharacterized protein n=1 Tax=Acinetobacter cumulans TaxID=2136182 RepID=A0A498CWF2_9GAMM|nr:hypothetical protein [Acinetobacter cumulans]RLL32531.1 hypothetical protein D9K80_14020 [Acinetobacter cumulans]